MYHHKGNYHSDELDPFGHLVQYCILKLTAVFQLLKPSIVNWLCQVLNVGPYACHWVTTFPHFTLSWRLRGTAKTTGTQVLCVGYKPEMVP